MQKRLEEGAVASLFSHNCTINPSIQRVATLSAVIKPSVFQLNFAVGIINLLYFLLRLLATEDFLLFMFEMETIGTVLLEMSMDLRETSPC